MQTKLFLILWLGAFLGTGLLIGVWSNFCDAPIYKQLLDRGQVVSGVVSKLGGAHATFEYLYSVNGKTLSGIGFLADLHEKQVGTSVKVHYLPDKPQVSRVGDMNSRFRNAIASSLLFIVLYPGMIFLGLPLLYIMKSRFRFSVSVQSKT